ncbi:MAG: hypothetical protein Q4E32_09895 [Bacteroidales bacterium]|nr:hypothetical protein [Bacteroidales bacterium]
MEQEELKTIIESLGKGGIHVAGDFVVEKHVENEVNCVESGGIGIQIVNSKEQHTPLTVGDKEIKAAIEELLEERTAEGELIFRNKKQWWAVFRVLNVFCQYPSQMSAFDSKMKELEVAKVDANRDLTYDSLSKAPRDVPKIATCSPSSWDSFMNIGENYRQQVDVAEFLMLKLGLKS